MKQAQPVEQKMDQARADFVALSSLAQANFEQAQQEVMQAQTDLDKLMQEAPLPVMPVPQVNVSLDKTLEVLTGIHRKYVENRRRATTRQPGSRNPGVEGNPPDMFGYPVSGGWRTL